MTAALREVKLSDKFTVKQGRLFINGVQALARLPLVQQARDAARGMNTTGFFSGYRGSPLGGLDAALWAAKDALETAGVVFQPGVNEELAATAVTGSQQLDLIPNPQYDGVFALWYGKGPGVDRAMDAIKHGNYSGAHKQGGVLLAYGDDHPGKSSTLAHQSEQALAAQTVPSLYPAGVAEFIEFGLLGWELSRFSGLWVGFKCVNETVEQTATVDVDLDAIAIRVPELPEAAVNYTPIAINVLEEERRMVEDRLPRVHAFVKENRIDKVTLGGSGKLGIVTAGKAWQDTQQALALLGLNTASAESLGISIYKVGCIWPLEPSGLTDFAVTHDELLFVEEKKSFLENQARDILYNLDSRPAISGKYSPDGDALMPSHGYTTALQVAQVIAARLAAAGVDMTSQLESLTALQAACLKGTPDPGRLPYFCSGCPHSTSTKIPEGSLAMAGIGCHAMVGLFNRKTLLPLQMGGEGVNWVGLAPFTSTGHMFQNLGDGTYYHSGLLAVRAAVAAKVNITYKILYNDATAMTGGQPVDGPLSVGDITYQVMHEGVARCVVVSDHPEKFSQGIAPGVAVKHRDELDRIQRELREVPGCTVIVYEQTCAAEKRRRRKRGTFYNPPKRLFINDAVCEGCSDCSVQSTCVSLQPKPTAMGRKRVIDQSSCNKDFSCQKGFCPSFVSVYDAEPVKPKAQSVDAALIDALPAPIPSEMSAGAYGILITGVGGTGVVTVGAVLAMAAHLQGLASSVYDMTGLSQKNGAVFSHLKIAGDCQALTTQSIGQGEADLVLAFDMIAAGRADSLACMRKGRTRLVGNSAVAPTVKFQFDPSALTGIEAVRQRFDQDLGDSAVQLTDATGTALALCGDTIASNMFLVGYALQQGRLPLRLDAVEKAIELNGVAVEFNRKALHLGRLAAAMPEKIEQLKAVTIKPAVDLDTMTLAQIIDHRAALLTEYQDARLAEKYCRAVALISNAEQRIAPDQQALARAIAIHYAKLLAYKDEYEVARLHTSEAFRDSLAQVFGPNAKIRFNLAPPLLTRPDPVTGVAKKREFGAWVLPVFRVLAKLKSLRGTAFDVFGYTEERKMERRLIADYEQLMVRLDSELREDNYEVAVKLAQLPEMIKGFGHVKARNYAAAEAARATLWQQFETGVQPEVVKIQEVS